MTRSGLKGGLGDADSRSSYRTSVAALAAAQKTPRGVSLYSTHVNRPIGRRLAAAAHVLGMTPNQVSVVSGACSFAAIALIALRPPSVLLGWIIAALLALGFALDSADGQLARLRRAGSLAGEWLDHMIDCATKLTLHAAVLVAWYDAGIRGAVLLLPLAFQFTAVMLFFGGTLMGKQRELSGQVRAPQEPRARRLSWFLLLPADHGLLCWSFALWGWQDLFALTYGVLFVCTTLLLAAFCVAWFRDIRQHPMQRGADR